MHLSPIVLRTLRTHRMIPAGGRVLVALSGGPDSVALALLLRELEERGGFALAGIAHLNHGLRAAACDDEEFCRALAAQVGVPFHVERLAIRDLARDERRSIEDAARRARYRFFSRVLVEIGADVVATGHTLDDQAETFLLRLLRGAGTRGLAAILPVAGPVVRPLLEVRRDEIRGYLSGRAQPFCEDETNRDMSIPRNHVRHELIPYLEREFSTGISGILAREAELARHDEDRLRNEAIDFSGLIVLRSRGGGTVALDAGRLKSGSADWRPAETPAAVEIDAEGLAALHPALASRVARIALSILAPDRFVGFEHVQALLALAASPGAVSLPGQQAVGRGACIELTPEPFRGFANPFRFLLSIPGEVTLDAQGWAVSAEFVSEAAAGAVRLEGAVREPRPLAVAVRTDNLALPLAVRSRQPGDRFRPAGLGGRTKKLQDFLVDRKIAREERDLLPLVVDREDRIVWIVGHAVAEDFRVFDPSQGVIFLKARRLGGQG